MKTSTSRGRFHDGTKPSLRERLWRQGSILLVLLAPLLLLKPPALFAQVQSLVASNTAFALNLYQQLATDQGNLFLFPYSISTCLAMTYDGARGQTEAQMSHVLGFDTNQLAVRLRFRAAPDRRPEASQQTNAIECICQCAVDPNRLSFPARVSAKRQQHFQANINQADFATQGDAARTAINDWIAQETQNKITNMLEPGTINGRRAAGFGQCDLLSGRLDRGLCHFQHHHPTFLSFLQQPGAGAADASTHGGEDRLGHFLQLHGDRQLPGA